MLYPRPLALVLSVTLAAGTVSAEVNDNKARYLDGTWTATKKPSEGKLEYLSSAEAATFTADKKKLGTLAITYNRVTRMTYGHKVSRGGGPGWFAFGPPIVVVAALGVGAATSMMHKNHERFVSIAWMDEQNTQQTATFELGKNIARSFVFNIETRTGKKIEFESDEAKANLGR